MKSIGQKTYRAAASIGFVGLLLVGCSGSTVPRVTGAADAPPEDAPVAEASSGSLVEAIEAIEAGEFERARAMLDELLLTRGTSPQVHYYQGVALQNLGSNEQAIEHFEKALELNPKLAEATLNLAAVLLDEGRADEALPLIENSLLAEPKQPAMLYNRALALSSLGEVDKAAEAFAQAVTAMPQDMAIRYGYAEALLRAKDRQGARKILLSLSEGNDREILASSARLLGQLKEFAACIRALDKAIAKQLDAELLVRRGLCQHGRQKDDAALLDFQQAQKLDPNFAPAHFYVGMHWKLAGDKQRAKVAFDRAVALAGDSKLGKAAARAIASL